MPPCSSGYHWDLIPSAPLRLPCREGVLTCFKIKCSYPCLQLQQVFFHGSLWKARTQRRSRLHFLKVGRGLLSHIRLSKAELEQKVLLRLCRFITRRCLVRLQQENTPEPAPHSPRPSSLRSDPILHSPASRPASCTLSHPARVRMYACLYACMCVYMHVPVCEQTLACSLACEGYGARGPTQTLSVCLCLCLCLRLGVCLYVCMYVFMYVRTYISMYANLCRMQVCMYACMHTCPYVLLHTQTHTFWLGTNNCERRQAGLTMKKQKSRT